MSRVLGVLGGMGPLASADFMRQLTLRTPADRDQDHIPAILWSDPRVPDRTAARLAKENGAKVILITHYDDAPGAALADVVLLCGAQENPLDSVSIPAKLAMLFVANVLVLRYTLDNQELANLSLSRTSQALGSKLL